MSSKRAHLTWVARYGKARQRLLLRRALPKDRLLLQGQAASLNDLIDVIKRKNFKLIKSREFVLERIQRLKKVDSFIKNMRWRS